MTYSIVARDAASGQLGVASASHYFGVGRVVTWGRAGVGAVATQSFVEPGYGPDGLALLSGGGTAPGVLARLKSADVDAELRQVAIVDARGAVGVFTGARCVGHHADVVGEGFAVLGNMLANAAVVPAMAQAYTDAQGDLADRMLAALDAAEAAGGDARGRMSAAMVIVDGVQGKRIWDGRVLDIRVDDSVEPLAELRRLAVLSRAHRVFADSVFTPGLLSRDTPTTGDELTAALHALDSAGRVIGDDPEPLMWSGVLLARAGRDIEAGHALRRAVDRREPYADYLDQLHAVAILPQPGHHYLADPPDPIGVSSSRPSVSEHT
ncbi:DUF1028 domain-containing protein [Microbacterium trichothecenolyticum]|uniref:DUF1028 domain-containing protein n=1 Tax=Microbacterium ureisolvens TaxID=2781186 RepID=A0ABS7I0V7_9MICO|nr:MULTISPECIES: DUF1028 domain-containing protein [Microbacterium]MBW9110461.1 DUF1028 domain-containing protein [Microbacterium ureisolvens]MBW9120566.1 DUF1028 domain-containing protein [Microbacterium trichothecenolyticum]